MLIFYITILVITLELILKTKRTLHMLQQNLYNENNRYLKWLSKNTKDFLNIELVAILITALSIKLFKTINIYCILTQILLMGIYIYKAIRWSTFLNNDQKKKPLVLTKRIKRLITTTIILYSIPIIFLTINHSNTQLDWIMLLIFMLLVYINPLLVFLGNIINLPVEKLVYMYYKSKAQKKLKAMNNLKIIGITGSYGKTSSKNVLADILNIKYNALPTPKNLNTYNGLIMTVNNHMDKFTDIFIAEMGAYVRGEIKGLCNLVKPQYGILTRIGTAHLETFGNEENIIRGKFELIESLPSNGVGVLNGDDFKQINYRLKNDCKIIWIGIENEYVDIRATNIKCSCKGTSFDVEFKKENKTYHFETKLLGDHNVYNILSALALGREFKIDYPDLIQAVKSVKPVEHRLELKKLGRFYQIDDAYNSNPVGASSALKVLNMMPGIKVVVTPGMIELGKKEDMYNEEFGEEIAKVADYVVLIGKTQTKAIQKGLKNKDYDKEKVIIYNDVRQAYNFINALTMEHAEDVYALFENDLPDTYNEN